jgi:hypothetical protein
LAQVYKMQVQVQVRVRFYKYINHHHHGQCQCLVSSMQLQLQLQLQLPRGIPNLQLQHGPRVLYKYNIQHNTQHTTHMPWLNG